jgi:magnesium transporter
MPVRTVFHFKEIAGKIRSMLFSKDDAALRALLPKTGDEDIVHVVDTLPPSEKRRLFRVLPVDQRSRIILQLSDYSQETILRSLPFPDLRAMIDASESDEAVDIIQLLDDARYERVIADLRKNDPHGLLPLLVFGEETAGGLMKTEVFRFRAERTVDDVRRSLAKDLGAKPKSYNIYAIDHGEVLVGTVSLMRLLQSPGDAKLHDIMHAAVVAVPPTMDQEEVAKVFDEHNAIELPVVGPKGRVLGVITADDIFDVMEEEHGEDVARLAGVHRDAHISDPVLVSVRRRIPWLTVNLGTAIIAGSVVGAFQDTIERAVTLAVFMPIVAGMGGNAAQQALGLTVRAIAFGDLHHLNTMRAIAKEVVVGMLNGLFTGSVMGALAYAWTGDGALSGIILAAMTLNLLMAGLGGVAVPVTMKALRIDPALASTVFVTSITDTFGFFALLGLATVFL